MDSTGSSRSCCSDAAFVAGSSLARRAARRDAARGVCGRRRCDGDGGDVPFAARGQRARSSSSSRCTVRMIASAEVSAMDYVLAKKKVVDDALGKLVTPGSKWTEAIWEGVAYSLLGSGKRIRPALCLAACELFGGRQEDALPTACALEMIHTMSLIHDDLPCMDNDDLRRGKPTNHVKFGEDMAVLAGDALLTYAFETIARTKGVAAERVLEVVRMIAESSGAEGLIGGQVIDLVSEGQKDTSLETLRWIHTHKTAELLRVSVASGAVLGGAAADDVARAADFATKVGLAFQIKDDVLDETGTAQSLGKTAGKDQKSYKATYPRLMGLEESQRTYQKLISEAKDLLRPYGERAATLSALADLIISRNK